MDPRLRSLKIKTGVVKRTGKEKLSYRVEAEQQRGKITKMKADGKDEADIKKMGDVMQESLNMIPDCHRRLEKAVADLEAVVKETEVDFADKEELEEAKKALETAAEQLKAQ